MKNERLLARKDSETGKCQSLVDHSRNVSRLCGESCEAVNLSALGRLLGIIHDMGKANDEWQKYLANPSNQERLDHGSAGAYWVWENSNNMILKKLSALIICGHHGGLMDTYDTDSTDNLNKRLEQYGRDKYLQAKGAFAEIASQEELLLLLREAEAEISIKYQQIVALPQVSREKTDIAEDALFSLALLARYVLSCLVDADRWDSCVSMQDNETKLPEAADWSTLSALLEEYVASLSKKSKASDLNAARKDISDSCRKNAACKPGIYRLSAPTGSGKTYASMRFALSHVKANGRIFYVAPFKTILEQTAKDIKGILGADCILEHHSDISERSEAYEIYAERWNMPIILTTMVQFLDTLFNGSNTCTRRFHSLADSVIILDEIQAVPIECNWMLNLAIRFLSGVCGSTVLLVTATQPAVTVDRIPGNRHGIQLSPPCDIAPDYRELFERSRRLNIVNMTDRALSADKLAGIMAERAERDKTVLCIVNTKRAAELLYSRIKSMNTGATLFCLTTNMCPQHRMDTLEKMKKHLLAKEPVICVSTQLIEAGVNISFHTVIRTLAGLDSVAQAAGRCNRNLEYEDGTVIIAALDTENTAKMQSVRQAQEATKSTLADYKRNSKQFKDSLFSAECIERYYQRLFFDNKKLLGFPTKVYNNSEIFDMLSRCTGANVKNNDIWRQAFRTAGQAFHVIEPGSVSVIVPYGEGAALISAIRGTTSFQELRVLLRRAQLFTVSMRRWDFNRLFESGMLEPHEKSGCYFLSASAYSAEETGVYINKTGGLEFFS